MRNFELGPIYGLIMRDCIWVRCHPFGHGLTIKKTPKLFSERQGFVKSIPLPRGRRIGFLKARGI